MNDIGIPQGASRNPLPDPLHGGGWLSRLGTLAPPSVSLSFASACVAVLVFGFLQRNADLRGLFKIAFCDNPSINLAIRLGLGFFTTGLAWAIVLRCRRRPGPLWPRFWAFGLAVFASVLATVQWQSWWPGQTSALDAATLACCSATLALWPRLLRLHPDNRLVQLIAPLSLFLVLSAILPGLYWMGGDVVAVWKRGLNSSITGLREKTQDLRRCGWEALGCSEEEFQAGLGELESVIDTPSWREATDKLQGNIALEQRYGDLVAAEVDLLDALAAELPRRLARQLKAIAEDQTDRGSDSVSNFKKLLPAASKLARIDSLKPIYLDMADKLIHAQMPALDEPPVLYTSSVNENGPWDANPAFANASRVAIGQHQRLKTLLTDLGSAVDAAAPGLKPLKDIYRQKSHQDWNLRLLDLEKDWGRHWLLPFLLEPPLQADAEISPVSLKSLLDLNVIGGLTASDIEGLLNLPRHEAEKLYKDHRAANCDKVAKQTVYRLDCRAYVAIARDKLALRVELRLIYDLKKNADRPDRVFFLLPLPAGITLENYAWELEKSLPEARDALQQLTSAIELQKSLREDGGLETAALLCPPKSGWACAEAWEFVQGSGQDYIKLVIYRH